MKTESSQASNTNRHSQPTGGPAMITQHSFRGPSAKLSVALTAALLLFAAPIAQAAEYFWNGDAGTSDWFTANNWDQNQVPPNQNDNVFIDVTANVLIDYASGSPDTAYAAGLYFADDARHPKGTVQTVGVTINSDVTADFLIAGRNEDNANVNQTGGDVLLNRNQTNAFYLALDGTTESSYTISGGSLAVQGKMWVDNGGGSARFTVEGSAPTSISVTDDFSYEQQDNGVWEALIDGAGITQLDVSGDATFAGGATVEADFLSGTTPYADTWTIMDVGGTVSGGDLLALSAPAGWSMDWTTEAGTGDSLLQITYIPEPSAGGLLLLGSALVLRRRRR